MNIGSNHALALAASLFLVCAPASADSVDFSGKWSVSGHMISANMYTLVRPVCDFQQSGDQLAGACTGPNGAGSAVGLTNGREVTWQWHIVPTNNIGIAGISSFNGRLGPDNVVRGSWTFSGRPGVSGQFTAIRP